MNYSILNLNSRIQKAVLSSTAVIASLVVCCAAAQSQFVQLHDFNSAVDGGVYTPYGGDLVLKGSVLYGTAQFGGANNNGTIWSMNVKTGSFHTLHDFLSDTDGGGPIGLTVSANMLYGTAVAGGANDNGTIWSFDITTAQFSKLHDLSSPDDGDRPRSVSVYGNALLGTALQGGANGDGTIWSLDLTTRSFSKVHDFTSHSDGRFPIGNQYCASRRSYLRNNLLWRNRRSRYSLVSGCGNRDLFHVAQFRTCK